MDPAPAPSLACASPVPGLRLRWARARRAALHTVVPDAPLHLEDDDLLAAAWAVDPEACLRRVFDNSRVLGQGFARTQRVDLTLRDVAQLLPALGAPCHHAEFVRVAGEQGFRCVSAPCAAAAHPGACDVWRESTHGLAAGLSSATCYSRLMSPAHGGAGCVDVLHHEPHSPLGYLPVTDAQQAGLDRVLAHLRALDSGTRVELLGIQQGALHYRLTPSRDGHGFDPHATLRRAMRRHCPDLPLCDASPRPVLAESH